MSTNLGTLAIDPTQDGSLPALTNFLSEAVFSEFCSHDMSTCVDNISTYIREDLTTRADLTDTILKTMIQDYLKRKISEPITSVNVAADLEESVIESIIARGHEELFFISNNLYVNPTKIANADVLTAELSTLLKIEPSILENKFKIRTKQHLEIIRKMSI